MSIVNTLRTRPTGDPYLHMMVHEAADTIEALTAERDALKSEIASTNERWEKSHQTALAIQDERDRLREELDAARTVMRSVRVFVTSREKIKHPEGTEWFESAIDAIDAAMRGKG